MGSAAQNTVFDQHRLEATAYRPMVDLASGAISAFEIQQVEEGPEGMVLCGQQPDGLSLARQLAAICAAPLHDMVLRYSQQSRVTATPSTTLVAGPSVQTAGVVVVQRPPASRVGHWSSQRSVVVTAVVARV